MNMASECYTLAQEAVAATTAASGSRIEAHTDDAEILTCEWTRLITAHRKLCVTFDYLDQFMTKREGLKSIPELCTDARDGCPAWVQAREAGWTPPSEMPEPELASEQPVLLVFSRDETLAVTVGDLACCDALLKQLRLVQPPPQVDKEMRLLVQSTRVAMMKLLEYTRCMKHMDNSGASDEEKAEFVAEYKKSMEPQDQLPLLFQTMTAANQVGCTTLLDELCKHVAEMIAQRTPNEIEDYFNIKKDATWEEEQELLATHKWIDPEGLIAKDREKRLAAKAREQA